MDDVTTTRFDAKVDDRLVDLANEENEWVRRLAELSAAKDKPKKKEKSPPPRKMNKLRRTSARQIAAVGR